MGPITVVVAGLGSHARAELRAALAACRGVRIAGEARDPWSAGELTRTVLPDAVVTDVNLLSEHDFFLTGWGPVSREVRIVAVGPDHPAIARRLRACGVAAYVVDDRLAADLPAALATTGLVNRPAGRGPAARSRGPRAPASRTSSRSRSAG